MYVTSCSKYFGVYKSKCCYGGLQKVDDLNYNNPETPC